MKAVAGLKLSCAAFTVVCSILIFISTSTAVPAQTAPPPDQRELLLVPGNLAELEGAVADIRSLLDEVEKADPVGGWVTNGKADYQARLNSELGTLLETLSGKVYQQTRTELNSVDLAISAGQDKLERLKTDLRLAPRGNGELSLADRALMRAAAAGSENAVKAEIATTEAGIDLARTARADIIDAFINIMAERFGYLLSQEQATALLYQVNGYSIVQSRIVFETIVALEKFLREGLDEASGATAVQRYYSVAAVSRLILVRMYQLHLDQYENRWLPRLAELAADNAKLTTDTRRSISETKTQRALLENNLKIQAKTKDAIGAYKILLERRRQTTVLGLAMAENEAAVAINTLKTLQGVFGFSAEMLSSTLEYESLMNLSSPELIPLDGDMLDQNFIALNQILGQS